MVEKKWKLPQLDDGFQEGPSIRVSQGDVASPLLSKLLRRRGILDEESAARFLHPKLGHLHDPFELPGMEEAVRRIETAIREGEKVAIFGDYDVDGISSTCLLCDFFRSIGFPVQYRLPNRLVEGYGLRSDAVRELAAAGARLIITVDNGSSACEEVDLASELGVDVVVTDHHQPPSVLPRACALVNPWVPGSSYRFKELAGVGVTFKLVWALCQRLSRQKKLSEEFRNFLLESLALVSLGTISDVVPLLGENRVLAKFGLIALERTRRPGLKLLVDSALNGRGDGRKIDASHIGFRLGPRINAVGRLGRADAAIRLLLAENDSEARELGQVLESENKRRQEIEQKMFDCARELVMNEVDLATTRAIVLAREGWHPGVLGIVAARITQEFFRPTLLIALEGGRGRGSARSVPGVHICQALSCCREHLISFGGHQMAAGVEVEPGRFAALRGALNRAISIDPARMVPEIEVDSQVSLSDLELGTIDQLSLLQPHGNGNPEPLLAAVGLDIAGEPRVLGDDGRHLAFHVRQEGVVLRAIAFGKGGLYRSIARSGARVSLLFEPRVSRWQGRCDVELNVREIRIL